MSVIVMQKGIQSATVFILYVWSDIVAPYSVSDTLYQSRHTSLHCMHAVLMMMCVRHLLPQGNHFSMINVVKNGKNSWLYSYILYHYQLKQVELLLVSIV